MAAIAAEAKGADAYRDVFAPQDETEAALQALTYADGLCAYFGAHLSGLMIGLVPYYPMSLSGPSPEGWMQAQQQANEEASASEQRLRAISSFLRTGRTFPEDILHNSVLKAVEAHHANSTAI